MKLKKFEGYQEHNTVARGSEIIPTAKTTTTPDANPNAAKLEIVFDNVQDIMKKLLEETQNMSNDEASKWIKNLIVDTKDRQLNIKTLVSQLSEQGNSEDAIAKELIDRYFEKTVINKDFDNVHSNETLPNPLMGEKRIIRFGDFKK